VRKSFNYKAVRVQRSLFASDEEESDTVDDPEPEVAEPEVEEPEVNLFKSVKVNDFVVASVIFNFGTKKEMTKFYVGQVTKLRVG